MERSPAVTIGSQGRAEPDADVAKKYPEYANLVHKLYESGETESAPETELVRWDKLFKYLETLAEMDASNEAVKSAMNTHYFALLHKYPHLVEYWRRFVAFEKRTHGLNRAVKILQRSVELFPNSLELWLEYIDVIVANNLHNNNVEFVRGLLARSLDQCGWQFLSHPLWDKALQWEADVASKGSLDYLNVLLQVIRIPLHQYAKYSTDFLELKNNFTLSELVPAEDLPANAADMSLDEQVEFSDEYFATVIQRTSDQTNARWVFEQNIQTSEFSLASPVPEAELDNWLEYLKFEEANGVKKQVVSLYERCLVPCSLYERFWCNYVKYLIRSGEDSAQVKATLDRGLRRVPEQFQALKLMYARYALSNEEVDEAFETLLQLDPLDADPRALEMVRMILSKEPTFEKDVDSFLALSYTDIPDPDREEPASKKRKTEGDSVTSFEQLQEKLVESVASEKFQAVIGKLTSFTRLNSVLVAERLRTLKDTKPKRDFYLKFINKTDIARDFEFLSSFVGFEIQHKNNKNLTNLLNYLLGYSQLPKHQEVLLLKKIVSFLSQNGATIPDMHRVLLEIDPYASFNYKKYAKSRNQVTDSMLLKENGHPGIETEAHKPTIANRLNFFQELTEIPPLPVYKNVEKANLAIKYPKVQEPI